MQPNGSKKSLITLFRSIGGGVCKLWLSSALRGAEIERMKEEIETRQQALSNYSRLQVQLRV